MGKKQSEKLTPASSHAQYPTLIELRQEGGILFKGLAAAVLATGLAGCGKTVETSLNPDASPADTHSAQTIEVGTSGTTDLGSVDGAPGDTRGPYLPDGGSPDWNMIIDGLPAVPPDTGPRADAPDASVVPDAPDAARPDFRSPDWIMDGVPYIPDAHNDTSPKDAPDGSSDSERDVK